MDGSQQPGRAPRPVRQRRAVQPDALARVDLRLAVERRVIGVLGDDHLGTVGSVGRRPSISRRRRGLDHFSPPRQPGRRTWAGGSPAPGAAPARCRAARKRPRRCGAGPAQHGQALLSMSIPAPAGSTAGNAQWLVRRFAARAALAGGSLASCSASAAASLCWTSSSPSSSWSMAGPRRGGRIDGAAAPS